MNLDTLKTAKELEEKIVGISRIYDVITTDAEIYDVGFGLDGSIKITPTELKRDDITSHKKLNGASVLVQKFMKDIKKLLIKDLTETQKLLEAL